MPKINEVENDWVSSALTRQNLVEHIEECSADFKPTWAEVEKYRIVERIGEMVADINGAAGYHMLELQDFLPPQETILTITFFKRYADYVLEIFACEGGAAAVTFYSLSKISEYWEQRFPKLFESKPSISLRLDCYPAQVLNDDLHRWFSYLLSKFDKKLKPDASEQMSEKEYAKFSASVRKKSE